MCTCSSSSLSYPYLTTVLAPFRFYRLCSNCTALHYFQILHSRHPFIFATPFCLHPFTRNVQSLSSTNHTCTPSASPKLPICFYRLPLHKSSLTTRAQELRAILIHTESPTSATVSVLSLAQALSSCFCVGLYLATFLAAYLSVRTHERDNNLNHTIQVFRLVHTV